MIPGPPGRFEIAVMVVAALVIVGSIPALAAYLFTHPKHSSSLADRINAACTRPGYRVADWTTGDEWNPLPPGVVQVRCEGPGGYGDSYNVAVAR